MIRRIITALAVAVAAVVTLAGAAVPAGARATHQPKAPSIRITGVAVDDYNFTPGTKVTYEPDSPLNACYDIGGADQDPYEVTVVFFIHETGIPKNAPTTLAMSTPWDTQTLPDPTELHPTFGSTWFTSKKHTIAALFGGSLAPGNDFHYDDEGTYGNVFNGFYSVYTTVKVGHKVLHARGALTVDCDD